MAVIALLGMRELSPGLRDQLMVSMNDRVLIEAKAKGINIEESLRNPWRQLIKPDVLISATGIAVFLAIYYTLVGFGLLYYVTVFGYSTKNANGLLNWSWGFNVIAVILIGLLSDKVRVRKPFMIAGGIGSAVMMVIYLMQAGHHPGYYPLAVMAAALSFCLGVAYVPWMASFTETVEARNPALTATGLAIWGWIIRVVVFILIMILPSVINSMNPLVTYGSQVQALVAKYPAATLPPPLLAGLAQNPTPTRLAEAKQLLGPNYLQELIALKNAPASDLSYLQAHGAQVAKAATENPTKWKHWYWVCFGCMIFFLITVPLMRGRWSPKKAKEDEDAHEAMVQAELAKMGASATA